MFAFKSSLVSCPGGGVNSCKSHLMPSPLSASYNTTPVGYPTFVEFWSMPVPRLDTCRDWSVLWVPVYHGINLHMYHWLKPSCILAKSCLGRYSSTRHLIGSNPDNNQNNPMVVASFNHSTFSTWHPSLLSLMVTASLPFPLQLIQHQIKNREPVSGSSMIVTGSEKPSEKPFRLCQSTNLFLQVQ